MEVFFVVDREQCSSCKVGASESWILTMLKGRLVANGVYIGSILQTNIGMPVCLVLCLWYHCTWCDAVSSICSIISSEVRYLEITRTSSQIASTFCTTSLQKITLNIHKQPTLVYSDLQTWGFQNPDLWFQYVGSLFLWKFKLMMMLHGMQCCVGYVDFK